jgi:hypothetical protein
MKINILTRTHDRAEYFNICRESILNQTYSNINWIVGTDVDCPYYPSAIRLMKEPIAIKPKNIPDGQYYAPWNWYLNILGTNIKEGWVMYLDDDDIFTNNDALQIIVDNIDNDNQLMIWRVQITPEFIVPKEESMGKVIRAGDISGIGIMFHSKHLPVNWGNTSYGDYRIISQLIDKGLEPKWINQILTSTINGSHYGQ